MYKKFIPLTLLTFSLGCFSLCSSFMPRELERDNQRILRILKERDEIKNSRLRLSKKLGFIDCKLMRAKDAYIDEQTIYRDSRGYVGCRKHF